MSRVQSHEVKVSLQKFFRTRISRARVSAPFPRGIAKKGEMGCKNCKVHGGPYTRGSAYNHTLSDRESCRAMTTRHLYFLLRQLLRTIGDSEVIKPS